MNAKPHAVDYDKLAHEHTQFTDKVGDAVIRLQDEAYALGRERGRNEGNALLREALIGMVEAYARLKPPGYSQADCELLAKKALAGSAQ